MTISSGFFVENEEKVNFSASKLYKLGTKSKLKICDALPYEILLATIMRKLKQIR